MSHEEKRALKWQSMSCFIFGDGRGFTTSFRSVPPRQPGWDSECPSKTMGRISPQVFRCHCGFSPSNFSGDEGISTVSTNFLLAAHWPELESALFIPGLLMALQQTLHSKCYHPSLLLSHSSSFTTPGRYCVAVTIGTSTAVRIVLPFDPNLIRRLTSPKCGLWVYRVSQSEVIAGGSLTDGGSLADWLSQFLGTDRVAGDHH